jgi:hypothetical protein
MYISRSILHGYFNPLVFWYENGNIYVHQQRILFFAGYLRLAMILKSIETTVKHRRNHHHRLRIFTGSP